MKGQTRWIFLIILAALSLVGMLALWRSTPYGLGLVNDSATYVEGATSLLAGKGYVRVSGGGEIKPITHFPPLFSLIAGRIGFGWSGFASWGTGVDHPIIWGGYSFGWVERL